MKPDGILILNKPQGCTSHDMVNRMRRLYGTKQVGHTGTLDPMATGVLTILVGRSVKASEYAMASEKSYRAVLRLGLETDTEDITGTVLRRSEALPREAELERILPQFVGELMQIPPMVSAIKQNGKKLCELARQGVEVERQPRKITVYSLDARTVDAAAGRYELSVSCSKGTYIRTLCADIGRTLGCGGVMEELCRVKNGSFSVRDAVTPEELEQMTPEQRVRLLRPCEELFADCPRLLLPPFFAGLAHNGCEIYLHKLGVSLPAGTRCRLADADGFFALGEVVPFPDGDAVKPLKQFRL